MTNFLQVDVIFVKSVRITDQGSFCQVKNALAVVVSKLTSKKENRDEKSVADKEFEKSVTKCHRK
jgi:hypothetical protein